MLRTPLRAVLVDDEPPARERLRALLGDAARAGAPSVEVVGEAGNGREAVPLVHETRPDLVFLDVQMPVLDGFDVVDLLAPPRPHVVFVTAYDAYALRAFAVHALDYLTKPVEAPRLAAALARAAALVAAGLPTGPSGAGLDALRAERADRPLVRLTVRVGRSLRVVDPAEIAFFEAREKLVFARLGGADHAVDFTLDALERRLDPARFLRVHRAFVVNVGRVRELTPGFAGATRLRLDDGSVVPLSRRRAADVRARLGGR